MYGSAGQWERLQAEIASVRAAKKKQLRDMRDAQERRKTLIISVVAIAGLLVFIYYELKILGII